MNWRFFTIAILLLTTCAICSCSSSSELILGEDDPILEGVIDRAATAWLIQDQYIEKTVHSLDVSNVVYGNVYGPVYAGANISDDIPDSSDPFTDDICSIVVGINATNHPGESEKPGRLRAWAIRGENQVYEIPIPPDPGGILENAYKPAVTAHLE